MVGWRDGWKDGGSNSIETTGALDTLSPWTHTHTHRLGTQISEQFSGRMIGSLMRILPLQDRLITPAIPFHAAIPPSLLSFSHSPYLFFFLVAMTLNRPRPSPLHPPPSSSPFPSFFSPSLSLSPGLLCGYYNDRGDKGHLSHVRWGEREKALNRSRGKNTHTSRHIHIHTNTHTRTFSIERQKCTRTAYMQICRDPCTFMHICSDR